MGAPHKFNIFHYLMFEISDLKAKKLPELQEIAKELNVPKFKSLKKLDLVYQILDVQASNPKAEAESAEEGTTEEAPPRKAPQKREPRSQKDDSKAANTSPQQQQQQKKDTKPQGNTPQKSQNNKRNNQ